MDRHRDVEDIKAAMPSFCGVLKGQSFSHPMHIRPINLRGVKNS